jgi:hypothetical protein
MSQNDITITRTELEQIIGQLREAAQDLRAYLDSRFDAEDSAAPTPYTDATIALGALERVAVRLERKAEIDAVVADARVLLARALSDSMN